MVRFCACPLCASAPRRESDFRLDDGSGLPYWLTNKGYAAPQWVSPFGASPTSTIPNSAIQTVNALINEDDVRWGSGAGQVTISYSFPWTSNGQAFWQDDYSDAGEPSAFSRFGLNSLQMQAARQALAEWSNVANIRFVEIAETSSNVGDIRFAFSSAVDADAWGWAYYPNNFWANGGDIWINTDYAGDPAWTVNTYNFEALMHEVGHAIGLKHPFSGSPRMPTALDVRNYTIMSYTDPPEDYFYNPSLGEYEFVGRQTPMVYDIQAIQHIYGANNNYNTGNNTYSFDPARPFYRSIWDAGGTDTISILNYSTANTIDLRPGSYSTIVYAGFNAPNNLGIAFNVTIENAIGGSGPDRITGNNAANALTGNGGNDTLDGGLGADTALFAGLRAQYQITRTAGGYQVRDLTANRDGTDQLANMEIARFSDRSVDFTVAAAAAGVNAGQLKTLLELYVGFFNRIPEAAGVKYWIDQLKATNDLTGVANQFYAAGVQFSAQTGYSATMTNAEFITKVYANVLGRSGATAPDAGEIGFWSEYLAVPGNSYGSMVIRMISDTHTNFTNHPVYGFVASLLTNKSTVANTYAIQQGLSYNTPEENITQGMAMAAAVTPTSTAAAIALIGVSDVFV
jgi:serralysin